MKHTYMGAVQSHAQDPTTLKRDWAESNQKRRPTSSLTPEPKGLRLPQPLDLSLELCLIFVQSGPRTVQRCVRQFLR